jgi:hypothetical protein
MCVVCVYTSIRCVLWGDSLVVCSVCVGCVFEVAKGRARVCLSSGLVVARTFVCIFVCLSSGQAARARAFSQSQVDIVEILS